MAYSVPAAITPHAAAQLILLNEIDLSGKWLDQHTTGVFDALLKLPIEEILALVDISDPSFWSTDEIPQFGSIESLIRVPSIVLSDGQSGGLNYALLGFKLKNDVNAKLEANIKFGENHGKGAALLGLISLKNKRFVASSLTSCFCGLPENVKKKLIVILFFRIPIVQALLKQARSTSVNGYDYMRELTTSTKKRRGQCLRAILQELSNLNINQLSQRIDNVYWDAEEEGVCEDA